VRSTALDPLQSFSVSLPSIYVEQVSRFGNADRVVRKEAAPHPGVVLDYGWCLEMRSITQCVAVGNYSENALAQRLTFEFKYTSP
jgi:hypothetical protein